MSSYAATVRRIAAEQRQRERDIRKKQAALKRELKELAKLTEQQQARLEVEEFENELEILLSVHKEASPDFDWKELAFALPPHPPCRWGQKAFKIESEALVANVPAPDLDSLAAKARQEDEAAFESAWSQYLSRHEEWARMKDLATRVLAGESRAYTEAINEFSAFAEIANLGSSIHLTIHDRSLLECRITVNGSTVIPSQVKSLTASGKLSTRAMPKAKFHEIYQDYVCGCVLRVAREALSLLPIGTVLVTASVSGMESATGQPADIPVVSVAIPRSTTEQLDFEKLDPSDSLENFIHRGQVKRSRTAGEFVAITPLSPTDLSQPTQRSLNLDALLVEAARSREQIAMRSKSLPKLALPE